MSSDAKTDYLEVQIEATDFPCEDLCVRKLTGHEAISRLFSFDVELISLDRFGVDPDSMTGADVTVVFLRSGVEVRRVHGMIAEVDDLLANHADFRAYRVRVVPRMFRLTLVEALEIFTTANKRESFQAGVTVPEIIEGKLAAVQLDADLEMRLLGGYPRREFISQYKETDLAFVSRLAEHLGISFFFEHKNGRDVVVFTDHAAGFPFVETVHFRSRGEHLDIFQLEARRRLVPHAYILRDYNYRNPLLDLTSDPAVIESGYAGGVVEYGAHFKTKEEGDALARIRAEEKHAGQLVFAGKSDLAALAAGMRFRLEGHPDLGSIELLMVEVHHEVSQVVAGSGAQGETSYGNTFRAIPADRTYRPPRVTPRPRVHGLVTGIIDAGPGGSDTVAQLDDQGRYRVRFIFDTLTPGEQQPSHPVRMAQNHAGENYGTHFPLKPGVEVVVGFVDGDPDRPVIVGAVPNPTKPSPIDIRSPTTHRIKTGAGIVIDLIDD
ncbi:MAG: type VI secretion system tip protein TssI/VgrG [Minicystis sp.]